MVCRLACFFISDPFWFWKLLTLKDVLYLFTAPPNLSSSPPPVHIFCYSVGSYLFIYFHGGAAPQGMTQMFKNRSTWLVRGSHKPFRQWLPRFTSPFRFLLFSLLSDICLQELRDCSCDFFFPLCWVGNSDAWAKELNHVSMKKVSTVLTWCLFKT